MKKIQYVSVGFRANEKTYNYKAVIDPEGEIKVPLKADDIVVCQVSANFGVPIKDSDISYTVGVVLDPAMKQNAIATRFIVQRVNLEESDALVARESAINKKKRERAELEAKLLREAKRKDKYEKIAAAVGKDSTDLANLKKIDADLEADGEEVEW